MVEGSKFSLKPNNGCSAEEYDAACNGFISLYQKMYQLVKISGMVLAKKREVGLSFP